MDDCPSLDTLWSRYRATPTADVRNALACHYLPFVERIARQVWSTLPNGAPDQLDLVANGVFGLLASLERFDPDRKCKFETFAAVRVRGAMLDYLREIDWAPRLVRQKQAAGEEVDVPALLSLHDAKTGRQANNRALVEVLSDRRTPPASDRVDRIEFLRAACRGLNTRERLIVIGYYFESRTFAEIGAELGVSESRISQMHSAIVPRLRKQLDRAA